MIFKFSINSDEEQVMQFEKELLDILLKVVDDKEMVAHEIHFCVHESILNIIQHTYKWNLKKPLEIRVDVASDRSGDKTLQITIKDIGPAITSAIIPPKSIEKFQLRKRGLYMISKIMDEFFIKAEGSGNITYLKKILSQKTEDVPII